MGNGMNKVLTGLYVGSVRDSKDQEQLQANGITHILSVHDNAKKGVDQTFEYLCILAADQPDQNISQYFPQCNDFIHEARLSGGAVLIHCLAGVSRSITILVAYLMSVTSLNWKDALDCVRSVRSIANPNLGFRKQLQEFQGRRLREEQKRLSQKFPDKVFRPEDEEEVKQLMSSYDTLLSRTSCSPQEPSPSASCPVSSSDVTPDAVTGNSENSCFKTPSSRA